MLAAYPNFCGGSGKSQSPIADGSMTVNWYLELGQSSGAAPRVLYPTPGVTSFATSTSSPGRGGVFVHKGHAYAVIGTQFGEITSAGAFTVLGTVAVDGNPATLCTNGDGGGEIFITSGNNGYIWDLVALTLTKVRTGATTMGACLDGFFIALDAATSTIYLSGLYDGQTWDPTQFAQRSIRPDPWVSMKVLDRYLWLFGSQTSEVWYDAGTSPFPFAPHPSGLVQYGCAAAFSPTEVAGSLIWLAATKDGLGPVVQASGFTPDVISSFAVEVAINGYSSASDAIGDTYHDLGHTFYVLTFPTGQDTWTFDATPTMNVSPADRWAERNTYLTESNRYDAWRPLYHGYCFGVHLMLDRSSGTIYRMSSDLGTDVDGRAIRRAMRPPFLFDNNKRLFIPAFELFLESGLGLQSGQGANPQVCVRTSGNGGKTWGAERWRSAGKVGQYGARCRWLRNGSGRRWQPEIVVSDPIPWRIVGAGVDVRREAAEAA